MMYSIVSANFYSPLARRSTGPYAAPTTPTHVSTQPHLPRPCPLSRPLLPSLVRVSSLPSFASSFAPVARFSLLVRWHSVARVTLAVSRCPRPLLLTSQVCTRDPSAGPIRTCSTTPYTALDYLSAPGKYFPCISQTNCSHYLGPESEDMQIGWNVVPLAKIYARRFSVRDGIA